MRDSLTHFFFRRFRFFFAAAIAAPTFSFGTAATLRASASNAPHPLGLLMRVLSGERHKSRAVDSAQYAPRQATAEHAAKNKAESHGVIADALVESERLLGDVAKEVKRRYRDIRAVNRAFEQRPEILQPVRVNRAAHVLNRVIDCGVIVTAPQAGVRAGFVSVNGRAVANVAADFAEQDFRVLAPECRCVNAARCERRSPLQNAMHGCLSDSAAPTNRFLAPPLVHIRGEAADVGCIGFRRSVEFLPTVNFHRLANPMQHKPRCFLRDADHAPEFVAADPVFAIRDRPNGYEPLIQTERAGLENRADLVRELLSTILAPVHTAGRDCADAIAGCAARRADRNAVGPADFPHVLLADFDVGEVARGFEKSLGSVHLVLLSKLTRTLPHCVCIGRCHQAIAQARAVAIGIATVAPQLILDHLGLLGVVVNHACQFDTQRAEIVVIRGMLGRAVPVGLFAEQISPAHAAPPVAFAAEIAITHLARCHCSHSVRIGPIADRYASSLTHHWW